MASPLEPGRLKAVIFDVDGTLYRQAPLRRAMALRLLRAHAFAPRRGLRTLKMLGAYRRAQEALRGKDRVHDLAALQLETAAVQTRLPGAEIAAQVQRWMEASPLDLLPRLAQPGVRDFVRALKVRGLALAVLSDYPAEEKLRALGLDGLFDLVLCAQSEEVGVFKPHPGGILRAIERLSVQPEQALYIGDRAEVDGAAALAAHVDCAILSSKPSLADEPFTRFASFAALQALFDKPLQRSTRS